MKQTLKDLTRKSVFLSMMLLACSGIFAKSKTKWAVNPELPMSVRMCQSEIIRNPEGWMLDFSTKLKWNYCHGLECQAFLDVYDRYGGDYLYKYVKQFADTMINENGRIYGYKKTNYNLDHVNSGKILFRLYEREKDPRYKIAMDTLLRTEDFGIKKYIRIKCGSMEFIWDHLFMLNMPQHLMNRKILQML